MFLLGQLISGTGQLLYPVVWFAAYHAPIAVGMIWLKLGREQFGELERGRRLRLALGFGLGLTVLFLPAGLIRSGSMGLMAAAAAWTILAFVVEKYLDMDIESGHRAVGALLLPVWFAWLLVGALLTLPGYL